MCNLSQGIYKEGLNQGIDGAVKLLREAGMEDEVILKKIMVQYHLSKEEAEQYIYVLC